MSDFGIPLHRQNDKRTENNKKKNRKMKKIVMMVVAAMMATMTVCAQNEQLKNEIGVSYGAGLSMIGDGIGNGIGNGLIEQGLGVYKWDNQKQFGSLSVEYFRHLNNPKLAVGVIGSFSRCSEDVILKSDNVKKGDRARNYFTVMPAIKYSWINKKHFALYSKGAVGITVMNVKSNQGTYSSNDSKVYFAFQASLVGVEFGGKLRGFVEAGVGEQGIVLAGLKYKF